MFDFLFFRGVSYYKDFAIYARYNTKERTMFSSLQLRNTKKEQALQNKLVWSVALCMVHETSKNPTFLLWTMNAYGNNRAAYSPSVSPALQTLSLTSQTRANSYSELLVWTQPPLQCLEVFAIIVKYFHYKRQLWQINHYYWCEWN